MIDNVEFITKEEYEELDGPAFVFIKSKGGRFRLDECRSYDALNQFSHDAMDTLEYYGTYDSAKGPFGSSYLTASEMSDFAGEIGAFGETYVVSGLRTAYRKRKLQVDIDDTSVFVPVIDDSGDVYLFTILDEEWEDYADALVQLEEKYGEEDYLPYQLIECGIMEDYEFEELNELEGYNFKTITRQEEEVTNTNRDEEYSNEVDGKVSVIIADGSQAAWRKVRALNVVRGRYISGLANKLFWDRDFLWSQQWGNQIKARLLTFSEAMVVRASRAMGNELRPLGMVATVMCHKSGKGINAEYYFASVRHNGKGEMLIELKMRSDSQVVQSEMKIGVR